MSKVKLQPGSLWPAVVNQTERGLRSGALVPIPTEQHVIADAGIPFLVHVAARHALERKQAASTYPAGAGRSNSPNPFLPYDEALFVADISATHVALLNKFNVVAHHLLMVTRSFEEQEMPLTRSDFVAMWACMREYDALAFYNSGEIAGASQRHKHLQMVPVPFATGGACCPMSVLLAEAAPETGPGNVAALPFAHSFSRLANGIERSSDVALDTHALYQAMLAALDLHPRAPAPYNLLVTRGWMLLVPRARECCGAISINGLGFAGSFFVKTDAALRYLRQHGPLAALASVVGRVDGSPR